MEIGVGVRHMRKSAFPLTSTSNLEQRDTKKSAPKQQSEANDHGVIWRRSGDIAKEVRPLEKRKRV